MHKESYIRKAKAWLDNNPELKGAGFVKFFNGKIYGWSRELNPAIVWKDKPGTIALGSDLSIFIAKGGNYFYGAEYWEAIDWDDIEQS